MSALMTLALGDLGKVVTGSTPPAKYPEWFAAEGMPFVTPTDITDGRRRVKTARFLSPAGTAGMAKRVIPPSTVCFVSIGSTIGKMCTTSTTSVTNQQINCLVVDRQKADPTYIYYALAQKSSYLKAIAGGSATPILNKTAFAAVEIDVLPVDEQRKVGKLLDALDDKIDCNHRAIDVAEALGDAIFTAKAIDSVALSDVALLTMGSSPPGSSYNEDGIGIPFYQGVRDFGRRYPGRRVWTTAPVRLAEPNDTLVSVRAPVGDLNRAAERCCVGRGVASARSEWASTIYYALRAASDLWRPFQQEGTVFGAINRPDLAAALLPWPNAESLKRVESGLAAIDSRIESLSIETEHLVRVREVLLPELFSGRMRVSEVAEVVA